MSGSGARTITGTIPPARRLTPRARLRGPTARFAAGVGTAARPTVARRSANATPHRTATMALVFGLGRRYRCRPVVHSWELVCDCSPGLHPRLGERRPRDTIGSPEARPRPTGAGTPDT